MTTNSHGQRLATELILEIAAAFISTKHSEERSGHWLEASSFHFGGIWLGYGLFPEF